MSITDIKEALIDKVKLMKKKDAEFFYAQLAENENYRDRDFYESWKDVPSEHKKSIQLGLNDLQKGRKKNFDVFAKFFAKKHSIAWQEK